MLEIIEDDYGDEWWFGGHGKGQIVVGEWVTGGGMGNPDLWEKRRRQAKIIAKALFEAGETD